MFWKLLLTIAVILLVVGRTPLLRNPIVRLVLPRSWVAALSLLPLSAPDARRGPSPRPARRVEPDPDASEAAPRPSSSRRWLDRNGRLLLFVLLLVGIAAWMATRAMITMEADAGAIPTPP